MNQRQELFCQHIWTGKSATEAAILAGYSPKFAATHSTRWLKMASIQQRLVALQDAVTAGRKVTKETKLNKLEEIFAFKPLPESISARDRVLAIAEHNKMEGDYAPEKHAILGKVIFEVRYVDRKKEVNTTE